MISMEQAEIKTFRDLHEEVVARGLCGKCGGCVSFCSADQLHALGMGEDDLPRYEDEERCLTCGICYMICPFTSELDGELQAKLDWRPPIGAYETITSARSTDSAVRAVATDGGVVTALLLYMLDKHIIDGAIVSRKTTAFSREPFIATDREGLITAAGSHFAGSAHLEELGDKYTTYAPTISAVRSLAKRYLHRAAIVGTPCQIRTIRKMQCLGILPAHIITFAIGLFCMENFAFDALGREWLQEKLHIDFADIDKLNIKEDVIVTLSDGSTIRLPFEQVDELARPACLACTDFTNAYSDLSCGGLGSPDGYTTVLIRTELGGQVYREALRQGYVEEITFEDSAQLASEKTKMMAKVFALARQKRERGEARLRELVPTQSARDEVVEEDGNRK